MKSAADDRTAIDVLNAVPADCDFWVRIDSSRRTLQVGGELDLATTPLLLEAADVVLATPGGLTVDLTAVTFLDAVALGALVGLRRRQSDNRAELRVFGNTRVHQIAAAGNLGSMVSLRVLAGPVTQDGHGL
jgi:anti-anti-sigma factor